MKSGLFSQLFKTSGSIQRTLRLVEWTILSLYYLLLLATPYSEFKSPKIWALSSLIVLSILSLIFPIDRPQWQRRIYIGAGLVIIFLARSGDWPLDILLFLLILKSCFLFGQREVIITTIISGIGWIAPLTWLIPNRNYIQRQHLIIVAQDHLFYQYFNEILGFIAVSTFILLFGFLLISEHRNQQQIKLLNQEVETLGTLVERTRIARNIHDTLGHSLTALGIQLEVAQQIYLSHPEKIAPRLDTAKELTDQCLQDIRNVVKALRHDNFDLAQGLTKLMIHLRQTQSLTTQTQLDLPGLSLQTSYQIYCIIQEGVTNIQKHADASHVSLRSSLSEGFLMIELSDNGNGFDLAKSTTGFGLQGMRERLQLVGGILQIRTAESAGTHLHLEIPYDRET
jgi:signal transduction histidine kinase